MFGHGIPECGTSENPPAQASLLLSLESVFGVAFSVLLYGEELTWMLLAGFALIFCAIVISEIFPRPKKSDPSALNSAYRPRVIFTEAYATGRPIGAQGFFSSTSIS